MFTETQDAGVKANESIDAPAEASSSPSKILGELTKVVSAVHLTAASALELLALETRRASLTLVWMIALALAAGLLVVSAWFGLMAVLAISAVALGLPWFAAILLLVVINLGVASGVIFMCIKMSKDLTFVASRRQFANILSKQAPLK